MENSDYETKIVKVLDALSKDELGDDDKPTFILTLHLLLQDAETGVVFQAQLQERDVRKIIRFNDALTSKQMIDLATALRQREEPIKLLVPKSGTELTAEDVFNSRSLDFKDNKKSNRSKRRRWSKNNNRSKSV
jgi:hypothetical protein